MDELAPGQVVADRYQIRSVIGTGGMAQVFLAVDRAAAAPKSVVLKRIHPHLATRADFVRMFYDEARIALRLEHPNIARVTALIEDEVAPMLVMEHVHGVSFLDWALATIDEPVQLHLIIEALRQVCDGLGYAHSLTDEGGTPLGIVHRDISPQNLLIDGSGTVKIIDFGVAKAAIRTDRTQAGVLKGKYPYMAPERVRGRGEDLRSDLFSVGVVAFELSTRRRLFWRGSDYQTLAAIVQGDVPAMSEVWPEAPRAWDALVRRALATDADARFQSAAEMRLALEGVAAQLGLPSDQQALAKVVTALQEEITEFDAPREPTEVEDSILKAETIPGLGRIAAPDTITSTPMLPPVPEVIELEPAPLRHGAGPPAGAAPPGLAVERAPTAGASRAEAAKEQDEAAKERGEEGGAPVGGPSVSADGPGYRVPQLPKVPYLSAPEESLVGCVGYAMDVVRAAVARRRVIAALGLEVAHLERERTQLLEEVGRRLRDMAKSIDRHSATRLAAVEARLSTNAEEVSRAAQVPLLEQELADLEARLPEEEGAVQTAGDGEERHAAETMLLFARQRQQQLQTLLAATRGAAAVPRRSGGAEAQQGKLLADLGRASWKGRMAPERAADLYRGLDRCQQGLETCRAMIRDQHQGMGQFERRPVAVAVLSILIPVLGIASVALLWLMSRAAGAGP